MGKVQTYSFPSEWTIHVAWLEGPRGRAAVVQSAALYQGVARIFGTKRDPWYRFWRSRLSPKAIRQSFLAHFEAACRQAGARTLRGAVPPRIWERSYGKWTGFVATGELEESVMGPLVVVEKSLEVPCQTP